MDVTLIWMTYVVLAVPKLADKNRTGTEIS